MDRALLEGVLQRERVDDRREHPHVVARDAVDPLRRGGDAADDVAAPDHDRRLDAEARDLTNLVRDAGHDHGLDAERLAAEEHLPGELQQDPVDRAGSAVLTS